MDSASSVAGTRFVYSRLESFGVVEVYSLVLEHRMGVLGCIGNLEGLTPSFRRRLVKLEAVESQ
jgi:hypothetical protein